MRQRWTPDTIRFLRDAAANSNYYQQIARRAAAFFPRSARVCDAGCGLGELSLALLPYCRHVTAVDVCPAPVADLADRLTAEQRARLEPVCGDVLAGRGWYDAMVFCLFGSMEEILSAVRTQCAGTAVAIKRDCAVHRFTAGGRDMTSHSAETAEALLRERGIPYRAETLELALDQPFRSVEDAEQFFRTYNPETAASPAELLRRLEPGPSPEFPLRLPNRKRLRLLAFPAEAVRGGAPGCPHSG
ncbi:MAG: hypothetical protein HFF70_05675 [Oscillospiraceae bacterium]|jgi:SAM-dependent methyltransferase|nr:hypothetical protein [Oscillospiraceae bacterium]